MIHGSKQTFLGNSGWGSSGPGEGQEGREGRLKLDKATGGGDFWMASSSQADHEAGGGNFTEIPLVDVGHLQKSWI